MEFSWDESKRQQTIADRNLDFRRADLFFDGRSVVHQSTPRNGEDRWKSTVRFEDLLFYTMVWTWRVESRHIISLRRAHAKEIRKYRDLYL